MSAVGRIHELLEVTEGDETIVVFRSDIVALCDVAAFARDLTEANADSDFDLAERLEGSLLAALARLARLDGEHFTAAGATSTCCRTAAPTPGGRHHEGDRWTCPTCTTEWVHAVEESEGCWWERACLDGEDAR